jgi:hypothetical protein
MLLADMMASSTPPVDARSPARAGMATLRTPMTAPVEVSMHTGIRIPGVLKAPNTLMLEPVRQPTGDHGRHQARHLASA